MQTILIRFTVNEVVRLEALAKTSSIRNNNL